MAEDTKKKEEQVKTEVAAAPVENKKKGSKVVKILKIAGFTTAGVVLFGAGFVAGNPKAQKKVKGVFKRGPKTDENKESVKETVMNEPQQPMGQEPQPKNRDFNNYRRQPRNYDGDQQRY